MADETDKEPSVLDDVRAAMQENAGGNDEQARG